MPSPISVGSGGGGSSGKKFGFGLFGKSKNNNNNNNNNSKEENVVVAVQTNENKVPEILKINSESFDGLEKEKIIVSDDDPEYALHNKILQMSNQSQGLGDTVFNEFMDEFKANFVRLQADRTAVIKRESGNFLVHIDSSVNDSQRSRIKYGSGVDYIAQRQYLNKTSMIENNLK